MLPHILRHQLLAVVGVAVAAQVATGVVCADVGGHKAGALFAGVFTRRQVQATMQRGFKNLLGHAAAAICAIRGQFVSLGTGTYRKAVLPPNLHKSLAQREPVGTGDTLHLRKIAPHFLVQINKADNAGVGVPGQHCCHAGELLNVAFNRIGVGKKNRVIPPADAVRADNLR